MSVETRLQDLVYRLARLRTAISRSQPEGFTPDMARLLHDKIAFLEGMISRLGGICAAVNCSTNIPDTLTGYVESIEGSIRGEAEVFDLVDEYTSKIIRLLVTLNARYKVAVLTAATSGLISGIGVLYALASNALAPGFYAAIAAIASLALGLSGAFLSRYPLGSTLSLLAALLLGVASGGLDVALFASLAAGFSGYSIIVRRGSRELMFG